MEQPLQDAFNFSALNPNRSSPSETIESLINRLMIESWLPNISFSSYYNACAPLSCTFQYNDRNNIFVVIATIIGLFGGLSLGYKLLILISLRLIEKFIDGISYQAFIQMIKHLFRFSDEKQIIDRMHFILLLTSLCTFYMLSAFIPQSLTKEYHVTSLSMYENLVKQFPDSSLQCSCSQISIKYESFFNIKPRFHEICSSDFVSPEWIEYYYSDGNLSSQYAFDDFRYSASFQFQGLALLCQLSKKIVDDEISQLITRYFIDAQLLSLHLLNERIQTFINDFQLTMPNLFLSTLLLIRETTGTNMIMNTISTNWKFSTADFPGLGWAAHTVPIVYGNCSCSISSKCVIPSQNMLAGCYPLEALLQLTLQCFYDQQCIDSTETFKAMNILSINSSRFNINTTLETIINQLTIEEYLTNISYEKYFNQCAPTSCFDSYVDRNNFIQGITSLVGLYGGLIIICRVIVVIIIKLIRSPSRQIIPIIN
ncbi:unnamed protein product [Adineta ricciae]|uniref:Uncharacterized protein n=1 Tax=Adineta ricciae TaxID=249248 RepID=A0A815VJ70_ADIRI|nr:unnamed protein product [Adineta ricciae]